MHTAKLWRAKLLEIQTYQRVVFRQKVSYCALFAIRVIKLRTNPRISVPEKILHTQAVCCVSYHMIDPTQPDAWDHFILRAISGGGSLIYYEDVAKYHLPFKCLYCQLDMITGSTYSWKWMFYRSLRDLYKDWLLGSAWMYWLQLYKVDINYPCRSKNIKLDPRKFITWETFPVINS